MRRYKFIHPVLFYIFFAGLLITTPIIGQPAVDNEENLIFARIPAPSLSNNILGIPKEQKIAICLPPAYNDPLKRFPVVYFLAGFGDEAAYYTNSMYQDLKMQVSIKNLTESKAIIDMIVVIVAGTNFLGGSFYINSEVGGNWEDYLLNDVISYVDATFRTLKDPNKRGITGHSMGGSAALNIGIKHPEIFGSIYALSPGLFDKNGLANSQMFAEPFLAEKFLRCEKENSELAKDKAYERLTQFCDNSRDLDLIFLLAYGMAFAPNAQKNAPYIDFPYKGKASKANLDKAIWKKWENGFGSWDEKIKQYKDNLLKFKSIGIDYGTKDENKWIVDGCKYLTKLMNDSKIPIKSVSFDGGHQDKMRERIEKFLLPFFSAVFEAK